MSIARIGFGVLLVLACLGSVAPDGVLPGGLEPYDKTLHFGGYFLLAIFGAVGWPRWRGGFLLGLPLLGLGLEMTQGYAPGREFDWADALVNGAGVGVAVALSAMVADLFRR